MAIEPRAVTIQDSSEIAPTLAMFVGSMMIPEPIMFTATMNVSCIKLIFFVSGTASPPSRARPRIGLADDVCVEPDPAVDRSEERRVGKACRTRRVCGARG